MTSDDEKCFDWPGGDPIKTNQFSFTIKVIISHSARGGADGLDDAATQQR